MKQSVRLQSLIGVLLVALLAAGCKSGPYPAPPNITYHRVPLSTERVFTEPEVFTIDNCNASTTQERWVERTLAVGETVVLDEEETEGIAASLGFSYYVEAVVQLKSEISNKYGVGLSSGQSKTQGVQINVGPRQTAVVTLQWIETWENGYFEVFRDGKSIGQVHYRLLADLRLNSSVKTYDCTFLGRVKQAITRYRIRAGIFAQSAWAWMSNKWKAARDTWPIGRLEWWVLGVALLLTAGVALFRSKHRQHLRKVRR